MPSYTLMLAAELRREHQKKRADRRAIAQYTDYIPPVTVEHWVVAEVSDLTGTVIRYWLGTDRDHWHKVVDRAAVFGSERMARICQSEFLVGEYYPQSKVIQLAF